MDVVAGRPARTALCLCGGGITGGMFEIGALAAIDDFIAGKDGGQPFSLNDFDMFVGTSAGSFLATCLATGVPARRLFRAALDDDRSFMAARRTDIFRFDARQGLGIVRDLFGVALASTARALRGKMELRDIPGVVISGVLESLPAGVFSLRHYERYLTRFLAHHGMPNHFSEVRRELYITANDLDSGHRVLFGQGELADVPIATAICASSAIPLFFEPVRWQGRDFIDGAVGKVEHADVALARGADLIIIVNPQVPIYNDPDREGLPTPLVGARHLRDKGLLAVWGQAGKMSTRTKLHQGVRRYQASHPSATLLVVEPPAEEADIFLANPMSFASQRRMLRFGYEATARLLQAQRPAWEAAFGRHRVRVDVGRLRAPWELTA
jgi:predicted acylesterase/phospholipase RssA